MVALGGYKGAEDMAVEQMTLNACCDPLVLMFCVQLYIYICTYLCIYVYIYIYYIHHSRTGTNLAALFKYLLGMACGGPFGASSKGSKGLSGSESGILLQ